MDDMLFLRRRGVLEGGFGAHDGLRDTDGLEGLDEVDGVLEDIQRTMRPGMNRRVRTSEAACQTEKNGGDDGGGGDVLGRTGTRGRRLSSMSMDASSGPGCDARMGTKKDHFLVSMPFKNTVELRHHIESQVLAVAQASGDLALRKAHNRAFGGTAPLAAALTQQSGQPSYITHGVDVEVWRACSAASCLLPPCPCLSSCVPIHVHDTTHSFTHSLSMIRTPSLTLDL
jgi:hypothetical protein